MKKIIVFIFALVLTAALLPGCGCRNSKPMDTMPTTQPTTAPTTVPTTQATQPTTQATRETIEDGNGPLPTNATAGADGDTSSATEDTGATGNARNRSSTQGGGTQGNGTQQGGGTFGGGNMR